MQRLAQLEHHVVGDVDQRRDRALARALQAPLHPGRRRRRGVHVADHARRRSGRNLRDRRSSPGTSRRSARGPVGVSGGTSGAPVSAATSRATPSTDRQSARFGVSLSVRSRSSSASTSRTIAADRRVGRQREQARRGRRRAPARRRAQHARATRRRAPSRLLDRRVPGQLGADERARRLHPGRDVRRAADDRERSRPAPHRPCTRVSRSAFGMLGDRQHLRRPRPRRTAARPGRSLRPRGRPSSAGARAPRWSTRGSTIVRSQFSENFIARRSGELPQEAQVVLEEQAQVVDRRSAASSGGRAPCRTRSPM